MLQGNLLTIGEPAPTATLAERRRLDEHSWIDVVRGYLVGGDELMSTLAHHVDWRQHRRRMFDREVDDPRLSRWWTDPDHAPHPALGDVRADLGERYGVEFGGVGLNYYRDGRDSVAFHRDRVVRECPEAVVAVRTLGSRRPFRVRPHGGGESIDLSPASGDLIVMGGRCQLDWEHGVPKCARPVGERISASWRWSVAGLPPD